MQPKRFSLSESGRSRFLDDMIGGLRCTYPQIKSVVLVLDKYTVSIVSSCLKQSELLEYDVLFIDKLELIRKKRPSVHAVYFISPTLDSMERVIADFSNSKDLQYRYGHLYFTTHIPQPVFDMLAAQKGILKHLLTLKQMNLDFICIQPNVFGFNGMAADVARAMYVSSNDADLEYHAKTLALKLSSIMPCFRNYTSVSVSFCGASKTKFCAAVASQFMDEVQRMQIAKLDKAEVNLEEAESINVVLFERSSDMATPLIHDYNYESLVHDLFEVDGSVVRATKKGDVILNDSIWHKYKYKYIGTVVQELTEEFRTFMETKYTIYSKKDTHELKTISFADLRKMVRNLPECQLSLKAYDTHIDLLEECLELFAKKQLAELGSLEQEIMAYSASTAKAKNVKPLIERLASGAINSDIDRARLSLLAVLRLDLQKSEIKKLITGIDTQYQKLLEMGLWIRDLELDMQSRLQGHTEASNQMFTNTSQIRLLAEHLFVHGKLPDTYTSLASENNPAVTVRKCMSLRKKASPQEVSAHMDGQKYVFFMVGGITKGEIAALNELALQYKECGIVVGSDSIINSKTYLEHLCDLLI